MDQRYIHHGWSRIVPPQYSPYHPDIPAHLPPASAAIEIRPRQEKSQKLPPPSTSSAVPNPRLVRGEDELGFNGLDRFATTYTPTWLTSLPPPLETWRLIISPPFPRDDYAPFFAPRLVFTYPSILSLPPHSFPVEPLNSVMAETDPTYYTRHFTQLLSLHLLSQTLEAERAMVYSAPVSVDVAQNSIQLHIPGVREDIPRLIPGDRLLMRGLYPAMSVPSTIAIEAEVVGLQKARGIVYVKSPALANMDKTLPKSPHSHYQINFSISATPICRAQDAVRIMASVNNWLFPAHPQFSRIPKDLTFTDPALNAAQRSAIYDIVTLSSDIPYLISGPPGTGKTKTLSEAVRQLLTTDATILVCAPSNTAADTIARRLGLPPSVLFRLNAPDRTFAEVSDDLLMYCHPVEGGFGLPPYPQLMRYRVVVCTMLDAAILQTARASNRDIVRIQEILFPHSRPKPHWTHLLVDEAAQASEPETLIPLSVVHAEGVSVVLCGDSHQLGPVISSLEARKGELDVSLLERLFQRDVYQAGSIHTTHLVQNYRSVAPILMVPSTMFYDDTLIASADAKLISWSELPNPNIPILFHGCEAEENWVDEGASWYNPGEIDATIQIVESLLGEIPDLQQNQIAILTPWREQVWRMRTQLRTSGYSGVDVGNIETYQGKEFRITILSCVRSKARFLEQDKKTNMGLFNERRRFNVAITRAKELLVIVGNANLLKDDPYWNGLLQIAHRNSLYRGPSVDLEKTGAYISRIESSLQRELEGEDAGMFLAGELARATLMGE